MKSYRYFFFLFLLACSQAVQAQDISGTWVGNYSKVFLMPRPKKLVVELFLHDDSLITGASHLYYNNNKYEHYTLTGVYHRADSTVYFKEDSTLGVDLGLFGDNALGNYTTRLIITDTAWLLSGRWRDNNTGLLHSPSSGVLLERPLPKKKDTLPVVATPPPAAREKDRNLERASDIQSLIEIPLTEKDSLKIELLDNINVDGDIISLYLDDSTVLRKQMLTAEPLILYLSLNRGEAVSKIRMAAESMGSDPPCTALMRITTRSGKLYQVDLSSNYQQNAVVELFLKE